MLYTSIELLFDHMHLYDVISDSTINLRGQDIILPSSIKKDIRFENCKFYCETIVLKDIYDFEFGMIFESCQISASIYIENCRINGIAFRNTRGLKVFSIAQDREKEHNCEINYLEFSNLTGTEISYNTKFFISGCTFSKWFSFENINMHSGTLKLPTIFSAQKKKREDNFRLVLMIQSFMMFFRSATMCFTMK